MLGSKRIRHCIGLDFDFNNVVVNEMAGSDPEFLLRENLPFMDSVERIAGKVKMPKNILPVTCLSGDGIMLKSLRLPGEVKEKEIGEAVRWQFKELDENMLLRYSVTGKSRFNNWLVVAAAVPKQVLDDISNKVVKFGLDEPCAIDLRVLALWRAAKHFRPEESDTALIVLEEGAGGARVVAGRETLELAREISGDNVEFEIRRTIAHYRSEFTDRVEILTVGNELPEDAAAMGMALYPVLSPKVNFLSGREKVQLIKRALPSRKILKTVAGAAVLWLCLTASPWLAAGWWDVKASAVGKDILNLKPALVKSDSIAARTAMVQEWCDVLKSFRPLSASFELDDMRYAIPKNCWLTDIQLVGEASAGKQDKSSQVKGQPQTANTQAPATGQQVSLPPPPAGYKITGYSIDVNSVAAFRDNLSKLPWTTKTSIIEITSDSKLGAYKFTVNIITTKGASENASNSTAGN
ncbi:MAG: PilN domain-containing protein [Peptococcaceae bacterium]|nr:PilN domain-containing protein [Peptococcaceae bacterium]